ncbi:unnamed protein product [Hermetia illucens]|uniref:Uncharacterized protein n=1 Tax=Hermetia illucens TaxID=343691 RepID=A0A7R8V5G9_HERIL|nr:unnamed protein product [Hermetia illucens]
MNYKPRFPPQHTEKCYCSRGCFCLTPDQPKTRCSREFVKIKSASGQLKPRPERIPDSVVQSRGQSRCSVHSLTQLSSQSCKSLLSQAPSKSSDLPLTDRRLQYEALKEDFHGPELRKDERDKCIRATELLNSRSNHELQDLNSFRLTNSKDCYGVLSQQSINQRLGRTAKPEHVCEFRYHLSSRGLLEPSYRNEAGETICPTCRKVLDAGTKHGTVPVLSQSSKHKFILEVQQDQLGQGKKTKVWSQPAAPANSLALAHQQRV